jgi:hypothetical protein
VIAAPKMSKVIASTYAFSVPSVLTRRSGNVRASFHLWSQQQANEVLRHGQPKFRLMDHDISAGLSFLSMRFHRLAQPLPCRPRQWPPSSPTAVEAWHDADEGLRQPDFAGP